MSEEEPNLEPRTWSFHDAASGVFDGRTLTGDADDLARQLAHLGAGVGAFEGVVDHHRYRLNLASGELEEYVPTKPSDDAWQAFSWDAAAWRWIPSRTAAAAAIDVRDRRAELLTACDWTQVADSPLTTEARASWSAYRQALRDISSQPGFPTEVSWPEPPA